jgi:hypothetical protein
VRQRDREQRVAVGRRLRDQIGADLAAPARPVVDHDIHLPAFAERLPDRARHHVGQPAGWKRHDVADRCARFRIVDALGPRQAGQQAGTRDDQFTSLHACVSVCTG